MAAVEKAWDKVPELERVPWRIQCRLLNGARVTKEDIIPHQDPRYGPDKYDTESFERAIQLELAQKECASQQSSPASNPVDDWSAVHAADWPASPDPPGSLSLVAEPTPHAADTPTAAPPSESVVQPKPHKSKPPPLTNANPADLLFAAWVSARELTDNLESRYNSVKQESRRLTAEREEWKQRFRNQQDKIKQLKLIVAIQNKTLAGLGLRGGKDPTGPMIITFSKEQKQRLLTRRSTDPYDYDENPAADIYSDSDDYEDGTYH